jgi:glycosyltransferase involved in cell wall biosynthesis
VNESPLISIVIPVYNGANYMRHAIDSALEQTYPHVEVLVVNDGSRDGGETEAIARSFGNRIRYFAKENGGVASALNLGVREMRGDYFSWLSHDDVYLPHKLETQVRALRGFERPVALYSNFEEIDAQGRRLRPVKFSPIPPERLRFELIRQHPVHGCSVLLPRVAFDDGGFDESRRTTQDYHFWFRAAARLPFHQTSDILIQSRRHGEQGSLTDAVHEESENLYRWMLMEFGAEDWKGSARSAAHAWFKLAVGLAVRKRCRGAADDAFRRCVAESIRLPNASRKMLRARVALARFQIPLEVRARVVARRFLLRVSQTAAR